MYEIVGISTGAGWSWEISSPSAEFEPVKDLFAFSALSASSFQLALDFSLSINAASATVREIGPLCAPDGVCPDASVV